MWFLIKYLSLLQDHRLLENLPNSDFARMLKIRVMEDLKVSLFLDYLFLFFERKFNTKCKIKTEMQNKITSAFSKSKKIHSW